MPCIRGENFFEKKIFPAPLSKNFNYLFRFSQLKSTVNYTTTRCRKQQKTPDSPIYNLDFSALEEEDSKSAAPTEDEDDSFDSADEQSMDNEDYIEHEHDEDTESDFDDDISLDENDEETDDDSDSSDED